MNQDPVAILPEICLAGGAVFGLLLGAWSPRRRQWLVRLLAAFACLLGLAATGVAMRRPPLMVFDSSYAVDIATNWARLLVLAATLLAICVSVDAVEGNKHEAEFYVLLMLGALGTIVLAGASDLLLLFAGYMLASVPLYALAGFAKDTLGVEASLKYYLFGALLGVTFLAGIAILYGTMRTTGYAGLNAAVARAPHAAVAIGLVGVLAGLLFKIGGVPAHFWVPDVTDGSTAPVAAFVTTVPKLGGLVAAFRLGEQVISASQVDWSLLIALLATASMTLGNLAAFFQTSVRRLLAYSTISQVGYLLMAVSVAGRSRLAMSSLLFYLAAYAVTNLGAFAVVCEFPAARNLVDYRGLARRHPGLATVLLVCLLGLVGTPPTAVFFGKLEVFSAAIDGGYLWLAVVAVLNTVASLFYYLRWIAPAFLSELDQVQPNRLRPAGRWAALGAYSAGVASILVGLAGGTVLPLTVGPMLR